MVFDSLAAEPPQASRRAGEVGRPRGPYKMIRRSLAMMVTTLRGKKEGGEGEIQGRGALKRAHRDMSMAPSMSANAGRMKEKQEADEKGGRAWFGGGGGAGTAGSPSTGAATGAASGGRRR